LLIVEEHRDIERLLDKLQLMSDAETDEYEIAQYSREAVQRIYLESLEHRFRGINRCC